MLNSNGTLLLLAGLLAGGWFAGLDSSSTIEAQSAQLGALQGKVDALQQAQWQHGIRHARVGYNAAVESTLLAAAQAECSDWSSECSRAEIRRVVDATLLDYFAAVSEHEFAASQAQELMRKPKSMITDRVSEQAKTAYAHAREFDEHQRSYWTSTLVLVYQAAQSIDEAGYFGREYRAGRSKAVKSDVMLEVVPTWDGLKSLLEADAAAK